VSIRLINGQWLIVDGKVGTEEACCCGDDCECLNVVFDTCGGSIDIEIESETWSPSLEWFLSQGVYRTFRRSLTLCFEEEEEEDPPPPVFEVPWYSARFAGVELECKPGEKLKVILDYGWATDEFDGSDQCYVRKTFEYVFEECDADGCPLGEATLVSTSVDEEDALCGDPKAMFDCQNALDAPQVTYNRLP
jgi:hypothetical protein